jgi:hypothetical protein
MRRRPGEIRDAIVKFLHRRRGDVAVGEIHRAVESIIGAPIPGSSIRSYLRLNTGEMFVRASRGRYRLRQE